MDLVGDKDKRVRVIIGYCEKGDTGIKAPTKTITIIGKTVKEVYNKLLKFLKTENGK